MRWSAKKLKNFILKEVRLLEKHAQSPHQAMGMHGVDDDYYSDEDLGMMHVHMHHHEDEEEMHPYDRADAMHDEEHGLDMPAGLDVPHGAMPDYQNPMDDQMHDEMDDYYGDHMGSEEHDLGPAHMEDDYAGFKDLHLYEADKDEDKDEDDLKEVDELEEEDEVDEAGCGTGGARGRRGMYEEDELEEGEKEDEDEGEKLEEGLRKVAETSRFA
jgi:hypothetical protein